MSGYAALLQAVRNRIRSALSWANKDCEVMADGRPKARAGKYFVAVHRSRRFNTRNEQTCLEQTYVFCVTVSTRIDGPQDQEGLSIYAENGLDERCEEILNLLHNDSLGYDTVNAANTLLGDPGDGNPPHGFRLAIKYLSDNEPAEKGGEWWQADPGERAAGWAQTMFFQAGRIQHLGNLVA